MTSLRGHERAEFPAAVKRAAFRRCCGTTGKPHCEGCGIELVSGNIEYEHVIPDGLGGSNTPDNCKVLCRKACARSKTDQEDNPVMVKADRVLRKSFGLQPKRSKIQSRGFAQSRPQRRASTPVDKWTGYQR